MGPGAHEELNKLHVPEPQPLLPAQLCSLSCPEPSFSLPSSRQKHSNSVCAGSGFVFQFIRDCHQSQGQTELISGQPNPQGLLKELKPEPWEGRQDLTPAVLNTSTALYTFCLKCVFKATFNTHGIKPIIHITPATTIPTGAGRNGIFQHMHQAPMGQRPHMHGGMS